MEKQRNSRSLRLIIALVLVVLLAFFVMQGTGKKTGVSGKVTEIEKYGHAILDVTIDDFQKAGFELGDIVTVTAGAFSEDVPYLNGYYVDRGECLLRAYPGDTNIAVCINYGNFAEKAGIHEGDPVNIMMKEKAGALDLQEINDLRYSIDRNDYASDEEFANFRPVVTGKLYRCASPVNDFFKRARYSDALIREVGVKTVMNLDDTTEEEIEKHFAEEGFASDYYKSLFDDGKVIPLGMSMDYTSDQFGSDIVKGFTFLAKHDTPYLVHCLEAKDRAGFAAMVLEALIGWSEEQIVSDYMMSYKNYYGIEPGTTKYDMIAEKNVKEMLRFVAGLESGASLEGVELQPIAENYLIERGMSEEDVKTLEKKLEELP